MSKGGEEIAPQSLEVYKHFVCLVAGATCPHHTNVCKRFVTLQMLILVFFLFFNKLFLNLAIWQLGQHSF